MSKFPDFIIVGAMKCGTTVLWHNMKNHPDITMCKNPEDPKKTSTEIRFWNNGGPYHTWKTRGIDWYKNLFTGNCCGEKSAEYIYSKTAMERIAKHIPKCKIILCARNPVDRAYSEYQMQLHTAPGKNKNGFEVAFKEHKGYRERGEYYSLLHNNVLPFFDKSQIFICLQELMSANTDDELNKLYSFLDVAPHHAPVTIVSSDKRDVDISDYKVWKTKYDPLTEDIRRNILNYYKTDNEKLFNFLGYKIDHWLI
jgi:hypothetical protein